MKLIGSFLEKPNLHDSTPDRFAETCSEGALGVEWYRELTFTRTRPAKISIPPPTLQIRIGGGKGFGSLPRRKLLGSSDRISGCMVTQILQKWNKV